MVEPDVQRKPAIMIVDDDRLSLNVLSRVLQLAGFRCTAFDRPDEALRAFNTDAPFEWLITDLRMPTMSGVELVRSVREIRPEVQIIITTAYEEYEELVRGAGMEVAAFFSKPLKIKELIAFLDSHVVA